MTSLYIDRRDVHLELDAGALVFRENGERIGTVPLAPLERVFIRGSATLQASLLTQMGDNGTGVVFLSGRKGEPTLFLGRPHNDASRRVAQTRLSLNPNFCVQTARWLIGLKLQRQQEWFSEMRQQQPRHRYPMSHALQLLKDHAAQIGTCGKLDSLRGIEGAAAVSYFAGLRALVPESWGFNERNRRPPRDPFNALLSLTYTLLIAETAITLHNAGLDPCVGYYHQISYSRQSLACDMVEPLRPLADRFCQRLIASATLAPEHFSTTSAGCLLGKAGRARYYAAWEEAAGDIRKTLAADIRTLALRINPDKPAPQPIQRASAEDPLQWQDADDEPLPAPVRTT